MKITVVGAGYVGLTFAAVLADFGHHVWIVRKDKEKNEALKKGKVHIFEPGLEELVRRNLQAGRFLPTLEYKESIPYSDIVFIAVGTPSFSTGEADLSQVFGAAEEIGKNLKKGFTVVVNKSTVPPGTTKEVFSIINRCRKSHSDFEINFCPEFLREGSAVEDTLHPDRVIIGSESPKSVEILTELHKSLNAPVLVTKIESAELIKYSANAYLALRIVFANQIADLCEKVGADVQEVLRGIGLDKRIGDHYWYPGLGYGGSCFPKDVAGLSWWAKAQGMEENLFEKMDILNKARIDIIVQRIENKLGSFKGKTVGILGLACKKGTDDIRSSPAICVIKILTEKGAKIQAYDPLAMENCKRVLDQVKPCDNPYEVAKGADYLFLLTDWVEFTSLDYQKVRELMNGNFIFDSRDLLVKETVEKLGFEYLGVGR